MEIPTSAAGSATDMISSFRQSCDCGCFRAPNSRGVQVVFYDDLFVRQVLKLIGSNI
jgi:hypothetical protein